MHKHDVRDADGRYSKIPCEVCGKRTSGGTFNGEPVEYWSADYALARGLVALCKPCSELDSAAGAAILDAKEAKELARPDEFVVVYANSRRAAARYTREFATAEEARAFAATRKRIWGATRIYSGLDAAGRPCRLREVLDV